MRRLLILAAAIIPVLEPSPMTAVLSAQTSPTTRPPNIIIITADDLGYGDLSSYGHPTIQTPALDQLAAEGQRWTSFYAQAPVCSPSRAALLTGRLHLRSGMFGRQTGVFFPDSQAGLPSDEVTLAEALGDIGYVTGIVGKWHLGHLPQYLPTQHGFDYWFGIPYSNDMDWNLPEGLDNRTAYFDPNVDYWRVPLMRNETVIERPAQQSTITRRYTEEAVRFIRDHQDQSFFLYLPHSMPHTPLFVSDAYRGRSAAGIYGDVIEELDWSVKQIVETIKSAGLDENTLIVFTSDNGPWLRFETHGGSAGLLRDGKGTTFEGGMRVPGIFWWPKRIAPDVIPDIGSSMDLFTTVLAVTGGTVPADRPIDGVDLSPVLFGNGPSPRHTMAYYRMGELFAFRLDAHKVHFITAGRYTLGPPRTEHDPPLLFNLNVDPGERYDVSASQPDVLAEVLAAVAQHRTTMTIAEPLFDLRSPP